MKKNMIFISLFFLFIAFLNSSDLTVTLMIPEGYKINLAAPNSLSLEFSSALQDDITLSFLSDSEIATVQIDDSNSRIMFSSLGIPYQTPLTITFKDATLVTNLLFKLILCDIEDEASCSFVEKQVELTNSIREAGELNILMSLE